jgi:hypothetical protein
MLPKHSTAFDTMFLTEALMVTFTFIPKRCTSIPLAFDKPAIPKVPRFWLCSVQLVLVMFLSNHTAKPSKGPTQQPKISI